VGIIIQTTAIWSNGSLSQTAQLFLSRSQSIIHCNRQLYNREHIWTNSPTWGYIFV